MVEKKKFTRAEIALRNSRSDAAFIIDNVVYDVTHFLDEHPGGHEVLLNGAGNDVSEEFHDVDHSIDAKELRKKYAIGEVVDEDKVEVKKRNSGRIESATAAPVETGFIDSWKFLLLIGIVVTIVYSYLFQ